MSSRILNSMYCILICINFQLFPPCFQQVSLSESDPSQYREFLNMSDYEVKQHQPLRLKKKIYEFYTAPITKFWADSVSAQVNHFAIYAENQMVSSDGVYFISHFLQMAYVFFLLMFTYTVLVKMAPTPRWQEIYSIAYITTLGCEKIREIISSEPVAIT